MNLSIKISHAGTAAETHSLILTTDDDRQLEVSYARTARGAKMCLSRYAKRNGFTKKSPCGTYAER